VIPKIVSNTFVSCLGRSGSTAGEIDCNPPAQNGYGDLSLVYPKVIPSAKIKFFHQGSLGPMLGVRRLRPF
jgi:hypothetical protein